MELPNYSKYSRIGEDGITILKKIIDSKLNWLFRVNHKEHDFGIDAYIDVITELGEVTGKSIAIQVKTGQSYFKEKNDIGWIYRGEMSHLNYYLNHDIPVVIVLVNNKTQKAYWCYCDASKTSKANKKWKITIPFSQELTESAKIELLRYVSPVKDYVSQLEHFWTINKRLEEAGNLSLVIDRTDITNLNIIRVKEVFERIQVTKELVLNMKEKLDISIYGYESDSRELYEIPEVKKWVLKAFEEISGWAYFLSKNEYSSFLRVLQLCKTNIEVCEDEYYFKNGVKKRKIIVDFPSGVPFLLNLFDDLNSFCTKYNFGEDINKQISKNIHEYIFTI